MHIYVINKIFFKNKKPTFSICGKLLLHRKRNKDKGGFSFFFLWGLGLVSVSQLGPHSIGITDMSHTMSLQTSDYYSLLSGLKDVPEASGPK